MLKNTFSFIILLSAFLQAEDDQYLSGSRSRKASGHSHFDAASVELAEKKRIKFRLGSGASNKISKLDRKVFGNQASALLLTMPSESVHSKRFKKKKEKKIEIETVEFTDEARKPPFLEEIAYNPLNNNIDKQDD